LQSQKIMKLGTFTVMVLLFGHMTQGLCFYYLKKKSIWNKFKWKILDNSNYANFHGGGDFSYAYVIIINILVKNQEYRKWINKLL
jgi:hypothetical protein